MRYATGLLWVVSIGLLLLSVSEGSALALCAGLTGSVVTAIGSTIYAAWATPPAPRGPHASP
jgi:hypothetical protein